MTRGEPDFTKRSKSKIDHWFIKGVELQDPTFPECVPTSIENDPIAYDAVNDRFKVDIEALTLGTLDVNPTDRWARQLGQIDLARVLGSALAHANPVITRLTDGSAWIDPRDVSDRAARLVGVVYGSQGQKLLQRATTYDLITQIRHNGAEIDPRNIRVLTSTDIITAYGNLDKLQQRASTKELIVQISHQGAEKDPTQIRALTNSDVVTAEQATAANLKATVTQASSDRTLSSIDATATEIQISNAFGAAGDYTCHTPAGGKKVRLKFLSLELSADVTLSWRWTTGGTHYYIRTTKGVYLANFIGANAEGAADEALVFTVDGAATIKGYALIKEV